MPAPDPETDNHTETDPELAAEQAHLAGSRAQLARMRDRTASMDSAAAGDWVSQQYLESTFALRMTALEDDPTVPLFFGRLDYERAARTSTSAAGTSRRGRRADGDRLAGRRSACRSTGPAATEPMGVGLRRRFGFQHGRLTAYEDEHLDGAAEQRGALSDPRGRDRAAARRADARHRGHHPARAGRHRARRPVASRSACRARPAPARPRSACTARRTCSTRTASSSPARACWWSGRTRSFLRYIGDVLPALGEIDARQTTVEELVGRTLAGSAGDAIRGADPAAVATLKGDARMAEVLRAGGLVARRPADRGAGRAARRAPVAGRRRTRSRRSSTSCAPAGSGTAPARAMLPQRLAHPVLVADGARRRLPRRPGAERRGPQPAGQGLRRRSCGPRSTRPGWCSGCSSEPDFLAAAADGILDADEQAACCWAKPPRSPGAARWSLPDAVLIDEAADLVERTPSPGAHRARRGPGPLADDAARRRPAVLAPAR